MIGFARVDCKGYSKEKFSKLFTERFRVKQLDTGLNRLNVFAGNRAVAAVLKDPLKNLKRIEDVRWAICTNLSKSRIAVFELAFGKEPGIMVITNGDIKRNWPKSTEPCAASRARSSKRPCLDQIENVPSEDSLFRVALRRMEEGGRW